MFSNRISVVVSKLCCLYEGILTGCHEQLKKNGSCFDPLFSFRFYKLRNASTSSVFSVAFASFSLMTRAGHPATTLLAGTSSMTTAPAATTAFFPICTPSITTAFAPIHTSSSTMTGVSLAGSITPPRTAPAPL